MPIAHLLEPSRIKNVLLKNRLAMPPMATGKALTNGYKSEVRFVEVPEGKVYEK
jgi:2,4-dienoyl-CoA reductase-like NADH-dependent reductase (Old Yellow Enzyme family)